MLCCFQFHLYLAKSSQNLGKGLVPLQIKSQLHLLRQPMGCDCVTWGIPHPVPVLGALAELGLANRSGVILEENTHGQPLAPLGMRKQWGTENWAGTRKGDVFSMLCVVFG